MLLEGKSTISMATFNSKMLVCHSLPMFTKGGKTHQKWWCSILMLNYQRVIIYVLLPAPVKQVYKSLVVWSFPWIIKINSMFWHFWWSFPFISVKTFFYNNIGWIIMVIYCYVTICTMIFLITRLIVTFPYTSMHIHAHPCISININCNLYI